MGQREKVQRHLYEKLTNRWMCCALWISHDTAKGEEAL